MLVKIHTSNFRIVGFTSAPSLEELVDLGRRSGLPVFEDLGSGLLVDDEVPGLEHEPRVRASLAAGVPLVCFSGDKLLGGPQCGILVGDRELCARVRAHPLYRALRCDKLVLSALEATLRIYRDGDPLTEIPTLASITRPAAELERAAGVLEGKLEGLGAQVVSSESFVGSGANPARPIPSFAIALPGGAGTAAALRRGAERAVIARIADDRVLLDLRTLVHEDLREVAAIVRRRLAQNGNHR
jgi:L-seryl-tRNA(Ser) seleniumtransferase